MSELKELIQSKIDYFPITIYNKQYFFRRWKVKDKKEFLLQKDSKNSLKDNTKLILKIINNLLKPNSKLKIENLPKEEIFKILIEIKKQSDGNEQEILVKCPHCEKETYTHIDINLIDNVKYKEIDLKPIEIDDYQFTISPVPFIKEIELLEKYTKENKGKTAEFNFNFLIEMIKTIVYEDNIYKNFSKSEISEFLDELDTGTFEKLYKKIEDAIGYCFIYKDDCVCEHCGKQFEFGIDDINLFLTL